MSGWGSWVIVGIAIVAFMLIAAAALYLADEPPEPDPRTHLCRRWKTIAIGTDTYIEECCDCGRQRARIYHR